MQRIVKDSKRDERRKRRKEINRINKSRNKHKKLRPKDVFDMEKFMNGTLEGKAPFYDKHEQHVHVWRNGSIPSLEKPTSKYFLKVKKPFTGRYCIICHKVSFPLMCDLRTDRTVDYYDQQEKLLINSLKQYSPNSPDGMFKKFGEMDLSEFSYKSIISNEHEIYLFIKNTMCRYTTPNNKSKIGKIVEIPNNNKEVTVEDNQGNTVKIHQDYVCPIYDDIDPKKAPVNMPPKTVTKYTHTYTHTPQPHKYDNQGQKQQQNLESKKWEIGNVELWNQLWMNYISWKSFVGFLKNYLPPVVGNYQTFDRHTLYNPHEKLPTYQSGKTPTEIRNKAIEKISNNLRSMEKKKRKRLYPFLLFSNPQPKNTDYYMVLDSDEDAKKLTRELKKLKI